MHCPVPQRLVSVCFPSCDSRAAARKAHLDRARATDNRQPANRRAGSKHLEEQTQEANKVVWTGRCDWDCDSVLTRVGGLGLLWTRPARTYGSLPYGRIKKNWAGGQINLFYQPYTRAREIFLNCSHKWVCRATLGVRFLKAKLTHLAQRPNSWSTVRASSCMALCLKNLPIGLSARHGRRYNHHQSRSDPDPRFDGRSRSNLPARRSRGASFAGPDRISWQHKAGMTEMLADLSRMVRTVDAYREF